MGIKFSQVTWYSRALTLLTLIAVIVAVFYIGTQYEDVIWQAKQNTQSLSPAQPGQTIVDVSSELVDESLDVPPLYGSGLQWVSALTVKKGALQYARERSVSGIFCGHTHKPEHFTSPDGVAYYNSGCLTDMPGTYITVGEDGVVIHEF